MFPFIEILGFKVSMTAIGIILALITFLITSYQLCKTNHQDFYKLFYQIPIWIIVAYLLWRYSSFVLENSTLIPHSQEDILSILSPKNFELHYVGLLITAIIGLGVFFGSIKRTENKKIRADIFFSSFCNALIVLGIFLTLGDTFIGKPTDSIIAIKALQEESGLTKFDGVYPIGLFLSVGALIIHIAITFLKIFTKKNGRGLLGMIAVIILLNVCFLYQNYPRYGLISIGNTTRDIKQYLSVATIILLMIMMYRRNKKRFY